MVTKYKKNVTSSVSILHDEWKMKHELYLILASS